jgi:hypothetical protein
LKLLKDELQGIFEKAEKKKRIIEKEIESLN